MDISLPKEPVYYYECSSGTFRLTYFMPLEYLREIVEQGGVSGKVLEDYPDGVDIGCTEPDFEEFHRLYGYRPSTAPDSILRAFYALLTTTRDWKKYRGTGFISAKDIQNYVEVVDARLERDHLAPEAIPKLPAHPSIEERRQRMIQIARRQSKVSNYLKQLPVEGIDPKLPLNQQKFTSIEVREGEKAAEVFTRLLRSKGKG